MSGPSSPPVRSGGENPFPPPGVAYQAEAPEYPKARPEGIRPSRRWIVGLLPAAIPLILICLAVYALASNAALGSFSFTRFFSTVWNPANNQYGTETLIIGTFVTALPALAAALLIALAVSIASVVYLPKILTRFLDPFVDLLAGIPSIVFAIWGYVFLAPYFGHTVEPAMVHYIGWIPGFGGPASPTGYGILLAVTILTLMILPITTILIRDALRAVPKDLVESGLALGATRWEVARRISLRYSGRGIWAAGLLGLARGIGEAVMIAAVLGSVAAIPVNIYSPSASLAGQMLALWDYALVTPAELTALVEIAFFLIIISLAANILGRRYMAGIAASGALG